ncbi:DUF4192 domain-containing protein [Parafrigoribacterium humi]|uniref:DUF4192 domain-containing protein n=1 Tax=Parafrigoribacterium humi TaxID=3144664 RepID=UPI0032F00905
MTVIVKASGPADILAMVPSLVHMVPRNSVVFLAFRGKRTCGAIRFDLPTAASKVIQKRMITSMIGTLCKLPGVDAVVPVIYTDDVFAGSTVIPHAEFADLVARRLELSGFTLRESLCQASDGWASYFDSSIPAGGRPLDEISGSSATEMIPPDLRELPDSNDMPRRVADAAPREMVRMRKRLDAYRRLIESVDGDSDDDFPAVLRPLGDLPLLAEEALTWDAAAIDEHGALLAFALQGPPVRDLMMLQWAAGIEVGDQIWNAGATSAEALVASSEHPGNVDVGDLMMGSAPRPDPDRIEKGIALLLVLVPQLADEKRPPLLCMLAWLNWALGAGSRAGRYLDEVIAIAPDYSMAAVLSTLFGIGLPEWAFEDRKRV